MASVERGVDFTVAQALRNHSSLNRTLSRLASGHRVERAADDPAGMAVAVNLQTTDIATRRAMKNMNDGVSLIQTAEGAAGVTVDVLQRMRELAVQGSSETLVGDDRDSAQVEYGGLLEEIDHVAQNAEFNGISLANGGVAGIVVHVGAGSGISHRISVQLGDLRASNLSVNGTSLASVATSRSALDSIDGAIDTVNGVRSRLGASHNRLIHALQSAEAYRSSLAQARSSIVDADYGYETTALALKQLRQSGGVTAVKNGLRSLESSRGLLASGLGRSGGGGFGLLGGEKSSGVPAYEKGDFPEDLIP